MTSGTLFRGVFVTNLINDAGIVSWKSLKWRKREITIFFVWEKVGRVGGGRGAITLARGLFGIDLRYTTAFPWPEVRATRYFIWNLGSLQSNLQSNLYFADTFRECSSFTVFARYRFLFRREYPPPPAP